VAWHKAANTFYNFLVGQASLLIGTQRRRYRPGVS
jgi:hypothetical protein